MFSTLLGALPFPPGVGESGDEAMRAVLAELDEIGLELVTSGSAPSRPGVAASEVVDGWRRAAALAASPVKQVLAGPYSAGRDGGPSGSAAIAETLRGTILALAEAGCPFVEIDEPDALAIAVVDGERRRFVDAHRWLTDGVTGVHLSLALTGGNLDTAGAATFFDLPYASYAFDLIAGPDNWRLIAAAPGDRGIVAAALDPRDEGDETKELLVWAAGYAASTGGRGLERIGLANAPSLAALPWDVALRKLRRIVEATRIAGAASGEMASLLDPRAVPRSGRARGRGGPFRLAEPEAE